MSPAFRLALRRAAEAAKEVLSSQQEATVQLPADPCTTSSSAPASTAVSNGGVASAVSSPTSSVTLTGERLEVTLTREQLEAACQSLVVRLWPPLEALLKDTRTQLSGKTPQLLPEWQQQQQQQRGASAAGAALGQGEGESGSGVATSAAGAGGSVDGDAPSTPRVWGRQFEVFAGGAADSGAAAKYAAPPRRLTGVVLVGAATRMPGVRRFIQHVSAWGTGQGLTRRGGEGKATAHLIRMVSGRDVAGMTGVVLVGAAMLTPGVRRFVQHVSARGRGGLGVGELKAAAHLGRRDGKGRDVVGLLRLGVVCPQWLCWLPPKPCCILGCAIAWFKLAKQFMCLNPVFLSDAGCSSFCEGCWRPHWLPLPPCVMRCKPLNPKPWTPEPKPSGDGSGAC